MATVLKYLSGKDNGKISATVRGQHGHAGLLYSKHPIAIPGLKVEGSQCHCAQADNRYYCTNEQITLTGSRACQELCCFLM